MNITFNPRRCIWGVLVLCASTTCAQPKTDAIVGLRDPFLDNLVGKWAVQSTAHGFSSNAVVEACWVMAHQHLFFHFIGKDTVPWLQVPMEFEYFIGYKQNAAKYVVHGVSVFGDDDYEGFCYAYRHGNDLDLMQKDNQQSDTTVVQRFTWNPATRSWLIQSWTEAGGKKDSVFLKMNLTAIK